MTPSSETLNCFPDDRLAGIVSRLVTALSPRAIYLFGSQLSGLAHRDSDVDIMVLMEDVMPGVELHKRGYACLRGLGLPVELHFSSRERFERFAEVVGSLSREIHRKGVLLYAAET
jgi:predicted nucleotidyltransferase